MTEKNWLASVDPKKMLELLPQLFSQKQLIKSNNRKLRLFACATFRTTGNWKNDSAMALETAENHADGLITDEELHLAHNKIPHDLIAKFLLRLSAYDAAACLLLHHFPGGPTDPSGYAIADEVADLLRDIFGNPFRPVALPTCDRCDGVRDIFGNPFRPMALPTCDRCDGDGKAHGPDRPFARLQQIGHPELCPVCAGRGWYAKWLTPTVLSLATAAYEHRTPHGHLDPVRLAVLADALEEEGCSQQCESCGGSQVGHDNNGMCGDCEGSGWVEHDILTHLRGAGPHVRGCWSLDLVLGKG